MKLTVCVFLNQLEKALHPDYFLYLLLKTVKRSNNLSLSMAKI